MNEAPTENTADRRILIKSSPVRCWREEPILIPSYVPAASVSRSVLRPQPLCRYRRRHRPCRGPYRARSRSDKHAAVLRLQRTQPKDRRVYTALSGILTVPQAVRKRHPGRRSRSRSRFICTRSPPGRESEAGRYEAQGIAES